MDINIIFHMENKIVKYLSGDMKNVINNNERNISRLIKILKCPR